MGYAIRMSIGCHKRTYFVQCADEQKALRKAFEMFKDMTECPLADTVEQAMELKEFCIETLAKIDQIII